MKYGQHTISTNINKVVPKEMMSEGACKYIKCQWTTPRLQVGSTMPIKKPKPVLCQFHFFPTFISANCELPLLSLLCQWVRCIQSHSYNLVLNQNEIIFLPCWVFLQPVSCWCDICPWCSSCWCSSPLRLIFFFTVVRIWAEVIISRRLCVGIQVVCSHDKG